MATRLLIIALVLFSLSRLARADEKAASKAETFNVASARFEQNATDGDVEAVFEAIGGEDGFEKLTIVAPDGHKIVDFSASGHATGMRQFRFESPEPTDVAALKKAFPEGDYVFSGSTRSGTQFKDKAMLSHKLPPTTSFVYPKADAHNAVPTRNLKISWAPVRGVAGYTVELDPSKSGAHLEAKLPASVTSFVVPEGILAPGAECQLGVGTVSKNGNVSVIEMTFATGGK
jgi:hypothetical protein